MRLDMNIKEYIAQVPKMELHCHLDGSIPKSTMEETLGKKLKDSEISVDMDCRSLAEYLEKFSIPLRVLNTKESLRKASRDFLRSLADDHVIYAETRFAPLFHVHENLGLRDVMEAVLEGLKDGERETGIRWGLLACAMRHHPVEDSLNMFREIKDYHGHGLVGLDLAGDEAAFSTSRFTELFAKAGKLGYRYTVHAGECGNVEEVKFALEAGARRIGHGIALRGNREIIRLCREKGVGIEMCPISNLQTKAVSNRAEYPLHEFLSEDLLCTVNTDNRTVSRTTLRKELEFLADHFPMEKETVDKLNKNAVEIAFAGDDVKESLLRKLDHR